MKQRHDPLLETTKGWIFDRKARENYCWEIIQDMIEKEVSAAFKIRPQPVCKRWNKKKLGKNEYWTPSHEPTMPTKKEIKRIIKDTIKGT
jgi:hypothetical protein